MLELLLIEAEPDERSPLAEALRARGHEVRVAGSELEALAVLSLRETKLILMRLGPRDGLSRESLRALRTRFPDVPVLLLVREGQVKDAIDALEEGAAGYATEPVAPELAAEWVQTEETRLDRGPEEHRLTSPVVGPSPATERLRRRIAVYGPTSSTVTIVGERGTPKRLLAEALHARSPRADRPLVTAARVFPETSLESRLFGDGPESEDATGLIGAARGGTLLIEEIQDLPLPLQARLSRALETGPLAPRQDLPPDVRLLASGPPDLRARVASGELREDLYYRVCVLELETPPLRERKADLPIAIDLLLAQLGPPGVRLTISPRALVALATYDFPGNDRELAAVIAWAVMRSRGGELELEHLPDMLAVAPADAQRRAFRPLSEAASDFERGYILRALRLAGGHKRRTAELLGISRKSLWKKMRALDVDVRAYRAAIPGTDEPEDDEEEEEEAVEIADA